MVHWICHKSDERKDILEKHPILILFFFFCFFALLGGREVFILIEVICLADNRQS